jgi:hypothetical protein
MQYGRDRIMTSHAGSLPRPDTLIAANQARIVDGRRVGRRSPTPTGFGHSQAVGGKLILRLPEEPLQPTTKACVAYGRALATEW